MNHQNIIALLGEQASYLLEHRCEKIKFNDLTLPDADIVSRSYALSARSIPVLCSLSRLFNSGRLARTGYLSILPVDQGIEHSAAGSFYKNPAYFDPKNIVELAIEGGCNAVVSAVGALATLARVYAHRIPLIGKLNHNELLSFPNKYDQCMYASVKQAWNAGAAGVGATIYFGSEQSRLQIQVVSEAFEEAHRLGMFTVLWCYLRNDKFVQKNTDYHLSADLTGQANYLGASIGADIIKQKLPICNRGYQAMELQSPRYGKFDLKSYDALLTEHPIDLCRYQVLHCFSGRVGLINSGGASLGTGDLEAVVRAAVINKRAGGMGIIAGRKVFQRPTADGISLLHAIQDVYLDKEITIA